MYIKEVENVNDLSQFEIQEDDVMTLINTLIANTKVESIDNTSGDPFWISN